MNAKKLKKLCAFLRKAGLLDRLSAADLAAIIRGAGMRQIKK